MKKIKIFFLKGQYLPRNIDTAVEFTLNSECLSGATGPII